jgi:hypothetical protein
VEGWHTERSWRIADARGDRLVYEFLNEVKEVVRSAAVEQEVRSVDAAGDAAP